MMIDDEDIARQVRYMYCCANMLKHRFYRSSRINVSSNFLCCLCAEILESAHFFREFTQSLVFKIQSGFQVRNEVQTKKIK